MKANNGDSIHLTVEWVAKWIDGRKIRMLGYNGEIPGPTLLVDQGSKITVVLKNNTSFQTGLFSHGLRLAWEVNGLPNASPPPVDSGESHSYTLTFPDPGIYWYHSNFRQDYGTELGLYGNYLVNPTDSTYWPPVHREVIMTLDDILLEEDSIRPFYQNMVDYTLMGRFGNHYLIHGDTVFTMAVKHEEIIRFYVTNTANARVFNLVLSDNKELFVIGADNGRYEYPKFRFSDIIAPSERLIFQIHFKRELGDADTLYLTHVYVDRSGFYVRKLLASFYYDSDTVKTNLNSSMDVVRSPHVTASLDPLRINFEKPPDKILHLTGNVDVSPVPKRSAAKHDPVNFDQLGIIWADELGPLSIQSDLTNSQWVLKDEATGLENNQMGWVFKTHDLVRIRVYNDPRSLPALPHILHFQGQRFLVIREQGNYQYDNLVWRDSYLVGRGFTVDLLLEASNPGNWKLGCQTPEHSQAGMETQFTVQTETPPGGPVHSWVLSLKMDSNTYLFKDDTAFTAMAPREISGQVVGYNTLMMGPALTFQNMNYPALWRAVLDGQGGFRFNSSQLLSGTRGKMEIQIIPEPGNPTIRLSPHRLRLYLNRAEKKPWNVDLDLAGDALFTGLNSDTAAWGFFQGDISGVLNGFDAQFFQDSIFFTNVQFPTASRAHAPLAQDNSFLFLADDILGGGDGSIDVIVSMRPKSNHYEPNPLSFQLTFNRRKAFSRGDLENKLKKTLSRK